MTQTPLPLILRAAKLVGGKRPNISKLARLLGAPRTALYSWRAVPPSYVLKLEKLTGGKITRHKIRPDVFGPKP